MSDSDRASGFRVAAIRGAIDVSSDTTDEIRRAVGELVRRIGERNALNADAIISAQFTMTPDLRSVFPATVARETGWPDVPMLCATAIDVPGSLPRCIRVLVHANLPAGRHAEHVYLGKAVSLRPDLHPKGGVK
ncbi:MAG TPA: chorismate mutase [Gemmatimonadaceae bacterium]|nr:chorismate mutase [Gemmatimonadaceae bacterium]